MEDLESESDCNSSDSGLDTGHSNLESTTNLAEDDIHDDGDGIYENADLLSPPGAGEKTTTPPMSRPLEKYEFGKSSHPSLSSDESVDFQDIDSFDTPATGGRRVWGVREETVPETPSPRTINPTEDKIAKEIQELKEREEELKRLREEAESRELSPDKDDSIQTPTKVENLRSPASHHVTQPLAIKPPDSRFIEKSGKFNPNNYRPVVLPPRSKMQEFIVNGGKVTAFTKPDKSVVQLRKPQVQKSQPKVSPPSKNESRHKNKSALDKIQEELLETRRREEELKNMRKSLLRSRQDLSEDTEGGVDSPQPHEEPEEQDPADEDECLSSLQNTGGKSGLISVWENRIQGEKA